MNKKLFLHQHKDFARICETARNEVKASLQIVEKDYWLMHTIWSLSQNGHKFELKGGTSLSKAWKVINRFSEDVDIHIHPPKEMKVYSGKNHDKPKHLESRKTFYNWLADNIIVDGSTSIIRDSEWDDKKARNCGIAISYPSQFPLLPAIKQHILLEVGFAEVEPNESLTISSWVFDIAKNAGLDVIDNRALNVKCYLPEYTFVEKLSAISGKYRQEQQQKIMPQNFIRHYYDIYKLLESDSVKNFIGTKEYYELKALRLKKSDISIAENEAFKLSCKETRERYREQYERTKELYYRDFPSFDEILKRIAVFIHKL